MKKGKPILAATRKKSSALVRAQTMIELVSRVGFQWPNLVGPLQKVEEELAELKAELQRKKPNLARIESELGDFLFTICNIAYFFRLSPEKSLHKMLHRFERRFNFVEKSVLKSGRSWRDLSFAELDQFWDEAKKEEKLKAKRKGRRT